jgi:hypothetical protein
VCSARVKTRIIVVNGTENSGISVDVFNHVFFPVYLIVKVRKKEDMKGIPIYCIL